MSKAIQTGFEVFRSEFLSQKHFKRILKVETRKFLATQ